jgi:hypothetical protein
MSLLSIIATTGGRIFEPPPVITPEEPTGISLLQRKILNSAMPSGWTATRSFGFVEFDLINSNPSGAAIDQDYEMFFTNAGSIRYVRFHDPAELQGLCDINADILIGSGIVYPGACKVGGVYYLVFNHLSTSTVRIISGTSIAQLQTAAASPLSAHIIGDNLQDPAIIQRPGGGFLLFAHNQTKAVTLSATNPLGEWTSNGYIFPQYPNGQKTDNYYSIGHADPSGWYDEDGRLYVMIHGMPYNHRQHPPYMTDHCVIAELDPVTFKAIGKPLQFIDSLSMAWNTFTNSGTGVSKQYKETGNPVFFEIQGRKEIWFTGNFEGPATFTYSSIAHYQIAATPTTEDLTGAVERSVKVLAGKTFDLATNIPHRTYGTVNNTGAGIVVSSADSGLWNFLGNTNLRDFQITCSFRLSALPLVNATVFRIVRDNNTSALWLRVNASGQVYLNGVLVGTATVGETFNVTYTRSGATQTINGVSSAEVIDLTDTAIYSLFNDKTDINGLANQMAGTIYSFNIDLNLPVFSDELRPTAMTSNSTVTPGGSTVFAVTLNKSTGGTIPFDVFTISGSGYSWPPSFTNGVTLGVYSINVPNGVSAFSFTINTPMASVAGDSYMPILGPISKRVTTA